VRAILITEYLDNYQSFEDYLQRCASAPTPDLRAKRRALCWTASWVRRMHQAGIQHSCLYTKHLFISISPSDVPVRGIDLEKAKCQPNAGKRLTHDLSSLFRRTAFLTRTDQLLFLFFYYGLTCSAGNPSYPGAVFKDPFPANNHNLPIGTTETDPRVFSLRYNQEIR
jgi:hypothetical protein